MKCQQNPLIQVGASLARQGVVMSRTANTAHKCLRSAVILSVLAVSVPCSLAAFGANDRDVSVATSVDLNTTTRVFYSGVELCFEIDVVSTGILTLDVSVSGLEAVEPRIALYDDASGGAEDGGKSLACIARTPTSMVLDIQASGTYAFCVSAQDSARSLDEVKIRNGFLSGGIRVAMDGDPEHDQPPTPWDAGWFAAKTEDDAEYEPPPDPKARSETVRGFLCQLGETDDHGDTPFCSTPLTRGRVVGGEIRNDWGDDNDFFVFALARHRTVRIKTFGDTDTLGGLYDHRGYRIASDDDGGDGGNFRIVKTLGPGIYFVRVEGRNREEGSYRLGVDIWR